MAREFYHEPYAKVALPNLIQIQTDSYYWFFKEGLKDLFDEINPVEDFTGTLFSLEFKDYYLEDPKVDELTCRNKNLTFKAPLRARVALHNKVTNKTKEAEVFLGDFPLMTDRGTFIINGVERVVVSQIVRTYGVLFVAEEALGRKLFGSKIIPSRGAWLEFETSPKDIIYVKVDRKRKIPFTTFLRALGMSELEISDSFRDLIDTDHNYLENTLAKDPAKDYESSLVEVYKRIRPGDLATPETAKSFIDALFFNFKRYDLGRVGRYKMNQRLGMSDSDDIKNRIVRKEDIVAVIREIINLNNNPEAMPDDIDALKNRRVRSVGELVQNKIRIGLLRMERNIRDRMSVVDPETVNPAQLVNSRPIVAVLQEFFASSQLSQFMNQTNPLSELENKRCLSATGPGGLSRERAGFEVRDVHPTHYGRICPIETPEGPNIGLVGYMAAYTKVNEYGFLEAPFLKVEHKKGQKPRVINEVEYLSASQEEKVVIAPASTLIDKDGYILENKTVVRKNSVPVIDKAENIQYMDVAAKETISIATSLIPFIEHDEATRAYMGSNMQRQAVPVVKGHSPVVGTGMEAEAAHYSGQVIYAEEPGEVVEVSADEISVRYKERVKTYRLHKFVRSNQGTSINQFPIVKVGDKVKKDSVLADSASTENGELALGQNVLCAFLSFKGGNYEDAIIISERLVKDDVYTSIHIEKYSIEVRDTKLGPEVITRDIPNVGEEALAHLDEQGIVRIGAEVGPGDILVGKISPKGETELSAEEKLLRAIFGEKAKDVKDTSLRLPHGEKGKVVEIKIFSRQAGDELPSGVDQMVEVAIAQLRKVSVGDKLAGRHGNKGVIAKILPVEDMPYLPDGTPVDIILNPLGVISRMNIGQILETHLGWAAQKMGKKVAVPSFESPNFNEIKAELKKAGLPETGKTVLIDGRTGERFEQDVTVGCIYMLKLIHLVDDKMHARSIGPYSMVTQQPLGGKAQFGGQRFGEMEVWALEAYGASHTLQEMLTVKSDDVIGRSKAYESIIRGESIQKPSIPASFFVLMRELQSLGLDIRLLDKAGHQKAIDAGIKSPAQDRGEKTTGELIGEEDFESNLEENLDEEEIRDREITEIPEEEPVLVSEPAEIINEE